MKTSAKEDMNEILCPIFWGKQDKTKHFKLIIVFS